MKQHGRLEVFVTWLIAAGLLDPLAFFLHECGHYAVAVVSGFPEAQLSFASASYRDSDIFWQALANGEREAASALYPIHLAGWVAAAGPMVTAFLIVGSVCLLIACKPLMLLLRFLQALR